MDQQQYTTLVQALADVPDPRKRRGRRYPWIMLLTLVSAAMASGQQHGRAIGQWVQEHAETLRDALEWAGRSLPSEATLRRTLRTVDLVALEERLRQINKPTPETTEQPHWQGLALDGKEVRGVRAHGRPLHLVSLARHDGIVLTQSAVADKTNEITAAPALLSGRDLSGQVVTVDALLAPPEAGVLRHQRELADQICQQHGHYLMVIKQNQPETYQAIALLFAEPPEAPAAAAVVGTLDKGHGRIEQRSLEASAALADWLRSPWRPVASGGLWPGGQQVLRRTCRRIVVATGEVSEGVTYGITSLAAHQADAVVLERLWRGHWTIENCVHYPRDVTLGEDAGQAYRGSTPQALAAPRNALLGLFRVQGWASIADAVRHYAASVDRAIVLIAAIPG
ncbi:MAG: ISAs1 family transposase [Chloroflexi bacterium]|nr:ISAs1 family transposase [Chloroflexota bacterium]